MKEGEKRKDTGEIEQHVQNGKAVQQEKKQPIKTMHTPKKEKKKKKQDIANKKSTSTILGLDECLAAPSGMEAIFTHWPHALCSVPT